MLNDDFNPGFLDFAYFVRSRILFHKQNLKRIIIPVEWFDVLQNEIIRVDAIRCSTGQVPVWFISPDGFLDGYENFVVKGIPICLSDNNEYKEEMIDDFNSGF